jgi:hypothetical protein
MDMPGVILIGKIEGVSFYRDPIMDEDMVLVGSRGIEVEPGYIYVDTQKWNEALAKAKPSAIEKDEVDQILKDAANNLDFSRVRFAVCNPKDDNDIQKMFKIIKEKWTLKN